MAKIVLSVLSVFLLTASIVCAQTADTPRDMGAPAFSQLPLDIVKKLKHEGLNEELYNKIRMRQVISVKRPTPPEKTGIHFTTYAMVAGSVQNTWSSIVDCGEKLKFVIHLTACFPTMPSVIPPAETIDGMTVKFLEYSKQEIKFSFTKMTYTLGVWVNKPNLYSFKQVQGGMRLNEGYWRIIPIAPKLLIINYSTLTDIGRIVPDFIGKSLTEKDLPDRVRLTRKYIEEVLEKRR